MFSHPISRFTLIGFSISSPFLLSFSLNSLHSISIDKKSFEYMQGTHYAYALIDYLCKKVVKQTATGPSHLLKKATAEKFLHKFPTEEGRRVFLEGLSDALRTINIKKVAQAKSLNHEEYKMLLSFYYVCLEFPVQDKMLYLDMCLFPENYSQPGNPVVERLASSWIICMQKAMEKSKQTSFYGMHDEKARSNTVYHALGVARKGNTKRFL